MQGQERHNMGGAGANPEESEAERARRSRDATARSAVSSTGGLIIGAAEPENDGGARRRSNRVRSLELTEHQVREQTQAQIRQLGLTRAALEAEEPGSKQSEQELQASDDEVHHLARAFVIFDYRTGLT